MVLAFPLEDVARAALILSRPTRSSRPSTRVRNYRARSDTVWLCSASLPAIEPLFRATVVLSAFVRFTSKWWLKPASAAWRALSATSIGFGAAFGTPKRAGNCRVAWSGEAVRHRGLKFPLLRCVLQKARVVELGSEYPRIKP